MGTVLFLSLRVLHVLLAAIWLGSTVFITVLMMPAVEATGAAGGQVMTRMVKGALIKYFAILGGTTTLTGIYLFWRLTGGFAPVISASRTGMVFGIGGVAGIIATIMGGSVVGRAATANVAVMEQAAGMPGGPEKEALLQRGGALRQRLKSAGTIVIVLQAIALILMALGHYI